MEKSASGTDIRTYLLALFRANDNAPIEGHIMLMKQSFILFKEIVPALSEEAHFFPHQWGPYSNVVAEQINAFVNQGYIRVYKEGRSEVFVLTEEGMRLAQGTTQGIAGDILQDISRMKRTTQEIGLKRVLRFVYSQYPQYSRRSRGKDAYVTR